MDMASQCGRHATDGTAELRGNGMFVRRAALEAVGGWNPGRPDRGPRALDPPGGGRRADRARAAGRGGGGGGGDPGGAVAAAAALGGGEPAAAAGARPRPASARRSVPLARKLDFLAFTDRVPDPAALRDHHPRPACVTIPLPRPADWTVPVSLFVGYGLGTFLLALAGLAAHGQRGAGAARARGPRLALPLALAGDRARGAAAHRDRPAGDRLRADAPHRPPLEPMSLPRATIVLTGQVVVSISGDGLQTAEAIGVGDGHVVAVGSRDDVLEVAAPGARMVAAGRGGHHPRHPRLPPAPGRHGARPPRGASRRVWPPSRRCWRSCAARAPRSCPTLWLRGWGWREELLAAGDLARLDEAVGERPALLYSHDGHSAWASAAARRAAGLGAESRRPARRPHRAWSRTATPSGILRESATDLVEAVAERLRGPGPGCRARRGARRACRPRDHRRHRRRRHDHR